MNTILTGRDFLARVDELLTERCMSDRDITRKVNLSSGAISRMRATGSDPKFRTIQLICIALDVSLSEFFNFNKKPKNGDYLSEYELKLVELSRESTPEGRGRLLAYAQGVSGQLENQ